MRREARGAFGRKIPVICILMTVMLMPGGCAVSAETRDDILSALGKEGYIGQDDDLEYEGKEMDSLTLSVSHYDYFYRDGDGDLYNVSIQPSYDGSGEYRIFIYYDVQVREETAESDGEKGEEKETGQTGEESVKWIVEDYDSYRELKAQQKKILLWEYIKIEEE